MIHNQKGQLVIHCSLRQWLPWRYKGDWLHRGLLHSSGQWENVVWNLVFISPGGQFGRMYVIPMTTRHIVQSSLRVQDGVSFFFKMESAQPVPFLPQWYMESSQTRDRTCVPCIGRWILIHCASKEVCRCFDCKAELLFCSLSQRRKCTDSCNWKV